MLRTAALTLTLLFTVGPAPAQVAIVSLRSTDAALADIRHAAPLAGQGGTVKQLDALVTMGGTLDGLDRAKPLGACVLWPSKIDKLAEVTFPVIFYAPVTDEAKFLALLGKLGCTVKAAEAGTHRLTVPGLGERHLRFAHGHAHVAAEAGWLAGKLPDPATFPPAGGQKTSLLLRLRVEHLPAERKKLLDLTFESFTAILRLLYPGAKGEKQEDGAAEIAENFRRGIDSFLAEARELAVAVNVDRKANEIGLEVTVTPRRGGDLDNWTKYAATAKSRFGRLVRAADLGLLLHLPTESGDADNRPLKADHFNDVLHLLNAKYRDVLAKGIPVVYDTLTRDGLDVCLIAADGRAGLMPVAGLKVRGGRKLEQTLRDLYKDLPAKDKKEWPIRWSVAEWKDERRGTARVHQLMPLYGFEPHLVVRDDVVLLAGSAAALETAKGVLAAFDAGSAEATPLFTGRAEARALLRAPSVARMMEKELSPEARQKLSLRIDLEGGAVLRLRVKLSADLLRLLPGRIE